MTFLVRFFSITTLALAALVSGHAQASEACANRVGQLAYRESVRDMGANAFQKYAEKTYARYEEASNESAGGGASLWQFLNDNLVNIAVGVNPDKIASVKKLVNWVALYVEYDQPMHSKIVALCDAYTAEISQLEAHFTWEGLADIIRKNTGR